MDYTRHENYFMGLSAKETAITHEHPGLHCGLPPSHNLSRFMVRFDAMKLYQC